MLRLMRGNRAEGCLSDERLALEVKLVEEMYVLRTGEDIREGACLPTAVFIFPA